MFLSLNIGLNLEKNHMNQTKNKTQKSTKDNITNHTDATIRHNYCVCCFSSKNYLQIERGNFQLGVVVSNVFFRYFQVVVGNFTCI